MEQTERLASSLLDVAQESGLQANVFVTRMDTPLGHYSGNRLEILESLQILRGDGPAASTELTKTFAERFLVFSGRSPENARKLIEESLKSGRAFEVFKAAIEAQGGSIAKFEKAQKGAKLKVKVITAKDDGYLWFEVRKLGLALVELGGGRKQKTDKIDYDVGFFHPLETGDKVEKDQEILKVYYREKSQLENTLRILSEAIQVKPEPLIKSPLIRGKGQGSYS
jgi:pyrimidine-nucleoside phosphorylase